MIEGVSGLLAVHLRHERPVWISSRKRLERLATGAVAQAFSAEDPESLRGPQFCCAWSDEMAKWRHAEATFDMLQFGLRLGNQPRQLITTTPRPTALLKRLMAEPSCAVTRAATTSNAFNLDDGVPVTSVRASRGKWLRAEPVATLYEQGRVKHAGCSLRWKTRCAISPAADCRRAARRTASTRWFGRWRRWR